MKLRSWHDLPESKWRKIALTLPDLSEPRNGLWSAGQLLKEVQSSPLLWVKTDEEELVALVTARSIDESVVEFIYLYTVPTHRQKGIMRALLKEVVESFPPDVQLWLEVAATNTRARGLYESLGFEPQGIRPKYYSDDTDSWLYRHYKKTESAPNDA